MEGEDGEEWRKLPCEDRIAHKVDISWIYPRDPQSVEDEENLKNCFSGVEGSGEWI